MSDDVMFSESAPMVPPPASAPAQPTFGQNLRATFGPLLIGLVGSGLLTFSVGMTAIQSLLKNLAETYDKYPSVERPWLGTGLFLPDKWLAVAVVLGIIGYFGMGYFAALWARSRDCWGDISVGLLTGLAATLATWPMMAVATVLAQAVVPSLPDLELLAKATQSLPTKKAADAPDALPAHPTDVLVEKYPDLKNIPGNERGERFFPKIVADQVVGCFYGVWAGLLLALASSGVLGLCGTLSAGYLLRRGGRPIELILPYLELTVPLSGFLCYSMVAPFNPEVVGLATWKNFALLLLLPIIAVTGVTYQWHWLLRATLYAVYYVFLWELQGHHLYWPGYVLTGTMGVVTLLYYFGPRTKLKAPGTR